MPDLKEIHARIRAKKDEKKKVNTVFKDVLAQSKPYQDVLEELKKLKAKKIQIENEIRSDFGKEMEQLERIALDVKTDEMLLTDLSLTMLMKGQPLELTDENDVKYEPVFKITFKKNRLAFNLGVNKFCGDLIQILFGVIVSGKIEDS